MNDSEACPDYSGIGTMVDSSGIAAIEICDGICLAQSRFSGNFDLPGVRAGGYLVGFTHPFLDSLGLEVPPLKLRVDGDTPLHLSLAIPTAIAIRSQLCPATQPTDSSGLLLGFLRDADSGTHLDSGRVVLEWTEVRVSKDGKSIIPDRRSVTANATHGAQLRVWGSDITTSTDDDGHFSLTGLPARR